MGWRICFTFPPPTNEVCFDIPRLWDPFRRPPPPRWITGIDDLLIKDLPILASIDALATDLSNASLRKTIQAAAQSGFKQPELKNVKINVGKKRG